MANSQIYYILGSILPEGIIEAMLIPLNPFIASALFPNSQDIGFYTGLLTSAFYLPLFLMNIIWGILSDNYGRKPVIMLGLIFGAFSILILGVSKIYALSLFARFLAGLFGSNSTIAKSMIGDISSNEHESAFGYSAYGAVFGFSGIVGPLISGMLYDPATLYPSSFDKNGFFSSHPHALPCIFGFSLTVLFTIITLYGLQEYNPNHLYQKTSHDDLEISLTDLNETLQTVDPTSPKKPSTGSFKHENPINLLKSKALLNPILIYCLISYCSMIYMTAIPIYLSASKNSHGLGLTAQQISICTMVISLVKFPLQIYGFQKLLVYFHSLADCYRFGLKLLLPVHILLPIISFYELSWTSWFILLSCMVLIGVAEVLSYISAIVMITESVNNLEKDMRMLGTIHGLASTCSALVRTLSPPISGFLWQIGKSPIVFGVNGAVILAFGIWGSLKMYPTKKP